MPLLIFVSPNSLDFGSVDAGESSELTATVRNVGQGPHLLIQCTLMVAKTLL